MKFLSPRDDWPDSWKMSYTYDLQEIYGKPDNLGYSYAYEQRFSITLNCIDQFLPPGSTIIDVAAGQGNFSLSLAERGFILTWNDLRDDLVEYVKLKYEKGTVNFIPGNAFELGFKECFDCVLISEVIEHVAHPDEFLINASAMVKPGGLIVMSTPNGRYFRNNLPKFSDCPDTSIFENVQFKPNSDGHIFLLWPDEVQWLAKTANLRILKSTYHSNPLTCGHLKLERLLKVLPKSSVMALEKFFNSLPSAIHSHFSYGSITVFKKPL